MRIKRKTIIPVATLVLLFGFGICVHHLKSKKRAKQTFSDFTGIAWQHSFSIVGFKDDRFGQGEFAILIEAPEQVVAALSLRSVWETSWNNGPVDCKIGHHCSFLYEEAPHVSRRNNEPPKYTGGSSEVRELLTSTETKWCALDMCLNPPWHSGSLLIIEPDKCKIWFSTWEW